MYETVIFQYENIFKTIVLSLLRWAKIRDFRSASSYFDSTFFYFSKKYLPPLKGKYCICGTFI